MINKLLILLILNIGFYNNCFCQTGILNSNFGDSGATFIAFQPYNIGRVVAIQIDGKILTTGYSSTGSSYSSISLARVNPNGILDESFGDDGKVILPAIIDHDEALAIKIQNDGKIILGGYSSILLANGTTINKVFTLIRFLENGQLDTSFGENGIVRQNLGNTGLFRTLKILDNGKILAAGDCFLNSIYQFVIMRFNIDGSLDSTFGVNGIFHSEICGYSSRCRSMDLDTNNNIILAGECSVNGLDNIFAIMRVLENGILDTSFGIEGKKTISIGGVSDNCRSVLVQPDGKILLSGDTILSTGGLDFCIVRLNQDGNFDDAFGNNGIVTKNISGDDRCYSAILKSDGNILLVGFTLYEQNPGVIITRFLPSGLTDTSFGINGNSIISHSQNNSYYFVQDAIEQVYGKIIISGYSRVQNQYLFFLMNVITDLNLGDLESSKESRFLFYPNPIIDFGVLNFELTSTQEVTIYLTDVSGKRIKQFLEKKKIPMGKIEEILDFSSIKSGTYLLTIKTEENQTTIKVIK